MGEVEIKAKLETITKETYLDFTKGTVLSLTINNSVITDCNKYYKDDKIELGAFQNDLYPGMMNLIRIKFSCDFADDGYGLNCSKVENLGYYHTQMEPDGAPKVFPCFNVPGLKNNFKLYLVSSEKYKYCSNARLISQLTNKDFVADDEQDLITKSNKILEFIPNGLAEVEFEYVYDLAVNLFGFAFGSYIKKGASMQIKSQKLYVRFFYTQSFPNLKHITDFYLFNITDAINL